MALMMSRKKSTGGNTAISLGTFAGGYSTSSATFDATSISGYANLTADDFFISGMSVSSQGASGGSGSITPAITYNASNGVVTVSPILLLNTSFISIYFPLSKISYLNILLNH